MRRTEKYDYSPFGESLGANHAHFGFSSEYNELLLGLVYYNYRYYDSMNGRWISRDPLEELAGLSLYAMVGNNPVGLYDMYGLDWFDDTSNFFAGMGDVLSLGLTQRFREYMGYDDVVDHDSGAYGYGEISGIALNTAIDVISVGGLGRQFLQCKNYAEVARLAAMLGASQATALLEQMALNSLLAQALCNGYLSPREAEAIKMALEAVALAARYRGAWRSGQRRCFAAGTLVLMADGQFRPIEEIGCGDFVLTCVDGVENVPAEVTEVFRGETLEWVEITVTGKVIRTTPEHLFRVGEEWVEARNLRVGMSLQDAYFAGQLITEVSIVCLPEPEPTYNFAIRVGRTYYVSEAAILAHNGCKKKEYGSYTITQGNQQYHGKGGQARMRQSARNHFNPKNGEIKYDWTPAANDEDAFIQEAIRIRNHNFDLFEKLNLINSPGENYLQRYGY